VSFEDDELEELEIGSDVTGVLSEIRRARKMKEPFDQTYFFLVDDLHTVEESVESALLYSGGGNLFGANIGQGSFQ